MSESLRMKTGSLEELGVGRGRERRWQTGGSWTCAPLSLPALASPAVGGTLRGEPVPRRGGTAHAAASLQALSPGFGDLRHVSHSVLRRFRGDPAAPGAAGSPPAAAAAGARQTDFLLPPAVPVAQGRQVSALPATPPVLTPQPFAGGQGFPHPGCAQSLWEPRPCPMSTTLVCVRPQCPLCESVFRRPASSHLVP